MVYESNQSLLKDINDYSVILHQANCEGIIQPGIAVSLCKQFPDWYKDYHGYCMWFAGGHEREILGTFHRHVPNSKKNLIICSAFAQERVGKRATEIDMEAWAKILRKIRLQTERAIKKTGKPWSIHVCNNIGAFSKNLLNEELMQLFNEVFGEDENVHLYIHATR